MLRKFTTKIIRENQAIFVEGLNVAGMVKNHNLAKHIADAAFGEIFRELEYKARWCGRTYLELDRFFENHLPAVRSANTTNREGE
ncbi:MAG: IS200/IS605 family accessory protein TnpB-related protein [Acidobacteria bacterium]|nr:IS200/IS605 family accessory protein TnpB-related protein [Acidobacteriota bacterium]